MAWRRYYRLFYRGGPERETAGNFAESRLAATVSENPQQSAVQLGTGGRKEMRVPNIELAAVAPGDNAARFAHQQQPGRHVPGLDLGGPKRVEPPLAT